jgi:hypothetical protein
VMQRTSFYRCLVVVKALLKECQELLNGAEFQSSASIDFFNASRHFPAGRASFRIQAKDKCALHGRLNVTISAKPQGEFSVLFRWRFDREQ